VLRISIQVVSLIAFLCSLLWVIDKPAFDSAFAIFVSLAGFLSSFLFEKAKEKPSNKQSQKISKGAIGIQAGGDMTPAEKTGHFLMVKSHQKESSNGQSKITI
jgi:hypothetical protein